MTPTGTIWPTQFQIQCEADGKPVAGLLVFALVRVRRGNDYHLLFGPTDGDGKVTLTRADLEREVRATRELFPADYTLDWAGEIGVRPLTVRDIEAAQRAYVLFKGAVAYPPGYEARLQAARQALLSLHPSQVTATAVNVVPANMPIRFTSHTVADPAAHTGLTVTI
jgi:hypothetical protein